MSKRTLLAILLLGVAGLWFNAPARAGRWGRHSVSVSTRDRGAWDDCQARYDISFADQDAFRAQEQQTLARSSFSTLQVHDVRHGGVAVHGWARPDVQITICKAVAASSQKEADELLGRIRLKVNAGDVTVENLPEDGDAWVGLLIQVPRGITMRVAAENGPISIQDVEGNVDAETENGPIAAHHCSGSLNVTAHNGPVSLEEGSGKVRLELQNGPLSVALAPGSWQGEGLEAFTQNGPLDLKVPANYRSGVQVEASWHSPFSCASEVCKSAVKDWDNQGRSRSLRLGPSDVPAVVRLRTVNGPVRVGSTTF